MRPRNEVLYEALLEVFGIVNLRHEGQEHSVLPSYYHINPEARVGRPAPPEADGENYVVACPFCRGGLVVNHRWGVRDRRTGVADLTLAHCERRCLDEPGRREQLLKLIRRGDSRWERGYWRGRDRWSSGFASSGEVPGPEQWSEADRISRPTQEFTLPLGEHAPVNTLSPSHPAVSYLTTQGFDPDEIATCWGVSYWEEVDSPLKFPRFLIPIYGVRECRHWQQEPHLSEPVLLGWVARALGPLEPGYPEVLSCPYMRKSHVVYEHRVYGRSGRLAVPKSRFMPFEDPRWKALCEESTVPMSVPRYPISPPTILVEEPEDVWRLGECAVAVFGSELSAFQAKVLWHSARQDPLVVFFNRGSRAAAEVAARMLRGTRTSEHWAHKPNEQVAIAELPEGRDAVRQCTPEEAWGRVFAALHG